MEKLNPTNDELQDDNGSNVWANCAQNQKRHQDYGSFAQELAYWKARSDQAFSLPVVKMIEDSDTDCLRLEQKANEKDQEKIRFEFNDAVLDYMEAHNLKAREITDALRN